MPTGRQLREVFHFCFLERLLKMTEAGLFALKGGVNLRFFFHSPRYSEDMDLDVLHGSTSTLKKNGYKLLDDAAFRRALRTYGVADLQVNDPDKAKHTETTQRFRVQLITTSGERLPTKVEFSRRNAGKETSADGCVTEQIDAEIARQYSRLSFRCQHYDGATAVIQKVLALAGRPVTQARDVFDLEILHRGGHAQGIALSKRVSAMKRSEALQNLDALTYDDFSGQVLEFLEGDARREYGSRETWSETVAHVRGFLSVR
jgi:predicted nucleotidyltransferase component of viral defense system